MTHLTNNEEMLESSSEENEKSVYLTERRFSGPTLCADSFESAQIKANNLEDGLFVIGMIPK